MSKRWLYHIEEPEGKIFADELVPHLLTLGWVERICDIGKVEEPKGEEPKKPGRPKKVIG